MAEPTRAHAPLHQDEGDAERPHPASPGPPHHPRPTPRPADDDDEDRETKRQRVASFSKWLSGVVPVNLIPGDLAAMLRHRANLRLDMAREQGVPLAQLSFGPDCLPTWPALCWDPAAESLHGVLQERLCDMQRAVDMSALLRHDVRAKSDARLGEARSLGLNLDAISVGPSLLPEWGPGRGPDEASSMSSTQTLAAAAAADSTTGDGLITAAPPSFVAHELASPDSGRCDGMSPRRFAMLAADADDDDDDDDDDMMADANVCRLPATRPTAVEREEERCPETSHDEWSDEEEEEEEEEDDDDDAQDVYLNNHLSPRAVYDEQHAASNMVYDVDLVGDGGTADVDLEVYLAVDDDSDYDHLPEVELAIDREAYEGCFGDEGAIDVYVPGGDIFCFDGIEEVGRDDDEEEEEDDDDDEVEVEIEEGEEEEEEEEEEEDDDDDNDEVEVEEEEEDDDDKVKVDVKKGKEQSEHGFVEGTPRDGGRQHDEDGAERDGLGVAASEDDDSEEADQGGATSSEDMSEEE